MRLIDADALEYHEIDEIGGEYNPYLGCSKEYIDRQPTVDVLDKIRAEIEQSRYGLVNDGLDLALKIIDRHMRRDSE